MRPVLSFLAMGMAVLTAPIISAPLTLTWDTNAEPDLLHYRVYQSVNSGAYAAPVMVLHPTNRVTFTNIIPGAAYHFYVTAVNQNHLESGPSEKVTFIPPLIPPSVSILSVQPSGATNGEWKDVRIAFSPTNFLDYQSTGVVIRATWSGGGASGSVFEWTATNSPLVVPTLPIRPYLFQGSIRNISGESPAGPGRALDSTPPAKVINPRILIQ